MVFFFFHHHSGAQQDSTRPLAGHASVVKRPGFRHSQPNFFPLEFGHRHVVPLGRHRSGAVHCSAEAALRWLGSSSPPLQFLTKLHFFWRKPCQVGSLMRHRVFWYQCQVFISTYPKSSLKQQNMFPNMFQIQLLFLIQEFLIRVVFEQY